MAIPEGQSWCTPNHAKFDKNWDVKYFWFVDDNKMSYKYILSINCILMDQLNTYNPTYCKETEDNQEN